jgi:hypothetical protein
MTRRYTHVGKLAAGKASGKGGRFQILRTASNFRAFHLHEHDLAAKPATDKQLAQIWQPWNALPEDILPEDKHRILTGDFYEIPLAKETQVEDNQNREQLGKLKRQFDYLPLDRSAYNQTFDKVLRWAALTKFLQTTLHGHEAMVESRMDRRHAPRRARFFTPSYKSLIEKLLNFQGYDDAHTSRVAIHRAANELELLRPGFFELAAPTLADIALLDDRYSSYLNAREQALTALSDLVFKVPGMRTGRVLPINERALGVPHPPVDVPRYLYIARLDALGICSSKRLKKFLRYELPKRNRPQRQKFERMRRKPKFGKEPYAGFLIWVFDNRPVFEHSSFGWQWSDIQKAAEDLHIDCPKSVLKQWAHRNRVVLKVKRGQPGSRARGFANSIRLLSPAPAFGDVLKAGGV